MLKTYRWLFLGFMVIVGQAYAVDPVDLPQISDPNKPIVVESTSPVFTLYLASNPTTGYSWFLTEISPANNTVVPVSRVYHKPQKIMPGAGGYEEWTFKVIPTAFGVPQVTIISLAYLRPWEGEFVKQLKFKVITHPK